jgi:hypothetical protein
MFLYCCSTDQLVKKKQKQFGRSRLNSTKQGLDFSMQHIDAQRKRYFPPDPFTTAQKQLAPFFMITGPFFGRSGNHIAALNVFLDFVFCCRGRGVIAAIPPYLKKMRPRIDFSHVPLPLNSSVPFLCQHLANNRSSGTYFEYFKMRPSRPVCNYGIDKRTVLGVVLFGESPVVRNKTPCNNKVYSNYAKNDSLIIHIRSGDVFQLGAPEIQTYRQPPVAFYAAILRHRAWKRIFIFTGDVPKAFINPVYSFLNSSQHNLWDSVKTSVKFIRGPEGNFMKDMMAMRCAYNFVRAHSWFSDIVITGSPYIHSVYYHDKCWRAAEENFPPSLDCRRVVLHGWRTDKAWSPTAAQKKTMITYPWENAKVVETTA